MSCCGGDAKKKPSGLTVSSRYAAAFTQPAAGDESTGSPRPEVLFEYRGSASLVVTGPITGREYRFPRQGAKIAVDRHDAPSLLYVPNLEPVAPE